MAVKYETKTVIVMIPTPEPAAEMVFPPEERKRERKFPWWVILVLLGFLALRKEGE